MKELNQIQTLLNAPKDLFNKFGGYRYRSCESILAALKHLLANEKCTLTISDEIVLIGDRYYVKATATLTNEKGESISASAYARESQDKKGLDHAQLTGATSSYARKYALNGLFAIDDTKDIDTEQYQMAGQQQQQNGTTLSPELSKALDEISKAEDLKSLKNIFTIYESLQNDSMFINALSTRKKQITI